MTIKTIHINLLGEPGAGKSTLAAGLYYYMKKKFFSVELVTEYAKDLTYEGVTSSNMDQIDVFNEQKNRIKRLEGKVDYIITDSPLSLSAFYASQNPKSKLLTPVILDVAREFSNLNFFVNRNHPYDVNGRSQTEEEALLMKGSLRDFLDKNGISFTDIRASDELPTWMFHGLFVTKELMKI